MKAALSLVCGAALLLAGPGAAQSLGEAAAKEKARRKAQKAPAKTYTDADVAHVAAADPAAPTPSESPAATGDAAQPSGEKSPDEQRADEQKAWRVEVDQAQSEVQRLDAEILRLEAEVNDTRGNLYSTRRTQALQDLEKARSDRATAQQKLDDVLERGRRKGFRAP
jgi:hypothetical protein